MSVSFTTGSQASIFQDWPGPAIDEAMTLVKNFLSWMGYPTGVDANSMALALLQNGLQANAMSAYRFLWSNANETIGWFTTEQRQAHVNAMFGLDNDSFNNRTAGLGTLFKNVLGLDEKYLQKGLTDPNRDAFQSIYYDALQFNLGQADLMRILQESPDIVKAQPWIGAGQTYQQSAQTYTSLYGAPPVDTPTLAAWWHFNQGVSTLQNRPEAVARAADVARLGGQGR